MTDIFISYSKENRSFVKKLDEDLSDLWTVWWDDKIKKNYDEEIEHEIENCSILVCILSKMSRLSQHVKDELRHADDCGKIILMIAIEPVKAPYGFMAKPKLELTNWQNKECHQNLREIRQKIEKLVPKRNAPTRHLPNIRDSLKFPSLFHSTSSFETKLDPNDALKALIQFGKGEAGTEITRSIPTALVSAYDLLKENCETKEDKETLIDIKENISKFRKDGGFILIDSGNYEAARLGDKAWSREKFGEALQGVEYDWVLSFDYGDADETGDRDTTSNLDEILNGIKEDQKITERPIIPILHATEDEEGYDLEDLPAIAKAISQKLNPPMIAIPERELGPGLIESAKTIVRIRKALDMLPNYQPIHILGTGNPWSIAIYSAAGADSFDGLEWCRMVVDRDSGQWFHNQHFSLLSHQKYDVISKIAEYSFTEESGVEYGGRIAFHNLDFLSEFACDLRKYTIEKDPRAFVNFWLPKRTLATIETEIPDLFK